MTDAGNFVVIPFSYQGVNFVSKIDKSSPYLGQILIMGEEFIEMNKAAINDIIPDLTSLSIDELDNRIAYINNGGTEMFLELAGN